MPSLISIWNTPQTRTRKKSEAISLTMLISSLSKYIFFLSFSSNSSRRHDIFSLIILFSLSVALSIINLFINTFHHYQNSNLSRFFACLWMPCKCLKHCFFAFLRFLFLLASILQTLILKAVCMKTGKLAKLEYGQQIIQINRYG